MNYPETTVTSAKPRSLLTSDMDELAKFLVHKNRRYTQLQPGKLESNYNEVSLNNVQIFKESIGIGARVEAAPAQFYLPFGYISPCSGDYRFCGHKGEDNSLIQASGGIWDISFNKRLDYICTAFNRDYFYSSYQLLTQQEVPEEFLVSKVTQTTLQHSAAFSLGLTNTIQKIFVNPKLLTKDKAVNLLSSQVLKLTLDALIPSIDLCLPLKVQPKRIQGTKRVIEYLQQYPEQLPDIQSLCKIANLSERSLQYGFLEHLGVTPIQYLRIVRLNGARRDLIAATVDTTKVIDIALDWGFMEFGRFSKEYKQLFNELPSQTLRSR
jgi:AraC family ethanolamine operon transcriptional activator